MRIVIAGGTGFLGRPLGEALARDGHEIVALSRHAPPNGTETAQPSHVSWTPDGRVGPWASVIDGAGAIVNLAGESIAARRWSGAQKRRILDSRVLATQSLVGAINGAARPPAVFVSGSAVGYYGPLGDEIADENHAAGTDFLAGVCSKWEEEAGRVNAAGTRLVRIRTGLVLERDGGALPKMLPPFWFGMGGPVGAGRQYWPWIHRADWIGLVRWTIANATATGAFNVSAPLPVTNAEFARALGRAVHRPAFMPAPGFAMKIVLGEMADALLLSGQRAVPAKAEGLGFTFRYKTIDEALRAIFH
jgi:uncharacterized protein (TIGR01777 family)